jgi:hypothetical protein
VLESGTYESPSGGVGRKRVEFVLPFVNVGR